MWTSTEDQSLKNASIKAFFDSFHLTNRDLFFCFYLQRFFFFICILHYSTVILLFSTLTSKGQRISLGLNVPISRLQVETWECQ